MSTPSQTLDAAPPVPSILPVGKDEVLQALREYLGAKKKCDAGAFDPNAKMLDYGYVDSLSLVDLMTHIEKTFGVTDIPQVELIGRLGTLTGLSQYVSDRMQKR